MIRLLPLLVLLLVGCAPRPFEALYVADTRNHRIVRMAAPDAPPEAFGTPGSGPGQFHLPTDVAVDAQGRLYVADMGNRRVVRIDDMSGRGWTEIADTTGEVFETPLRLALHPQNGDLFVADYNLNQIVRITDMDRATMRFYRDGWRTMDMPADVAFDRLGRMYVPNDESCRLIRVSDLDDYEGRSWEVWDGAGLEGPVPGTRGMIAVAIGPDDGIYLTIMAGDEVVRLDPDFRGAIRFGRRGSGAGELYDPRDLTFDAEGRLLILDAGNERIVRVDDIRGGGWTVFAEAGLKSPWSLNRPASLVQQVVGPAPSPSEVPKLLHLRDPSEGIGDVVKEPEPGGPPGKAPRPLGEIPSLGEGWLVVADTYNDRLVFLCRDGSEMVWRTLGSTGKGRLQFREPRGMTVDPQGRLVVVDTENYRLVRVDDPSGAGWTEYDGSADGQSFSQISSVACEPGTGRLFVSDPNRHCIVRVDGMSGGGWTVYGDGGVKFRNPDGLVFDRSGRLLTITTDTDFQVVRIADLADTHGSSWEFYDGADIRPLPGFRDGSDVAVDARGDVYATDPTNDRVVRVSGEFTDPSVFGEFGLERGRVFTPLGLETVGGRVFLVDSGNNRLVSFQPSRSRGGELAGWWEVGRAGGGEWQFMSPSFVRLWPTRR